MDKKIIIISFLLLIFISATVIFVSFNQSESEEEHIQYSTNDDISQDDVFNEIDDFLVEEDDEVDIGEML